MLLEGTKTRFRISSRAGILLPISSGSIADNSLRYRHGAGSGTALGIVEVRMIGVIVPCLGRFSSMTTGPGHRNPIVPRAMTVKAVAVRFWFPTDR